MRAVLGLQGVGQPFEVRHGHRERRVAARRSGNDAFSAKWMHTPALWFVPKLKPS